MPKAFFSPSSFQRKKPEVATTPTSRDTISRPPVSPGAVWADINACPAIAREREDAQTFGLDHRNRNLATNPSVRVSTPSDNDERRHSGSTCFPARQAIISNINHQEDGLSYSPSDFRRDRSVPSSSGRPSETISGLKGSSVSDAYLRNASSYRLVRPLCRTARSSSTRLDHRELALDALGRFRISNFR